MQAPAEPSAFETLAVRAERGVLRVVLDRPAARNAMSLRMVDELIAVLACAEAAGDVRVIVLRGAGGHLQDMALARQRELAGESEAIAAVNARFGALCGAFARTGIATVAVLEGTVMGGGLGLACVVDVALAGQGAQRRICASVAATKALMARALHTPSADLVEDAARLFARAARGPEGVEGMSAFLQKRAPAWAAS